MKNVVIKIKRGQCANKGDDWPALAKIVGTKSKTAYQTKGNRRRKILIEEVKEPATKLMQNYK